MNPLDLSDDAPWKARFRAPNMITQMASKNPNRGLVVSNKSGIYQLFAWDVPSGDLRQITDKPAGVTFGGISPDGEFIYYHNDEDGNEIGHFVRVPFDATLDTPRETIAPDLPPHASFSISTSLDGRTMGFNAADKNGFTMYVVDLDEAGQIIDRKILYRTNYLSFGPLLSHDGDFAAIATTERSKTTDNAIIAFPLPIDAPGRSHYGAVDGTGGQQRHAHRLRAGGRGCPPAGDERRLRL